MIHPLAYIIQDNVNRVNLCFSHLIKFNLVLDMELSYIDKFFITLRYITY